MNFVGRVSKEQLLREGRVRIEFPPFHVLVVHTEGRTFALEDACNHMGASLSTGRCVGQEISCPLHGYIFSLRTGALLRPAGKCGPQRTFIVIERGDAIEIYDDPPVLVHAPKVPSNEGSSE